MKDPTRIQINCLEFVVIIIQVAATIVWLRENPVGSTPPQFPGGVPALPILSTGTDNMSSEAWSNKGNSTSQAGQHLLVIYSGLLRSFKIGHDAYFIPGKDNIIPDDISRPASVITDHILSDPTALSLQIYQKHPFLRTYSRFLPSPELLQSLTSALYTTRAVAHPVELKTLGHFVPAGSTGSTSVM